MNFWGVSSEKKNSQKWNITHQHFFMDRCKRNMSDETHSKTLQRFFFIVKKVKL